MFGDFAVQCLHDAALTHFGGKLASACDLCYVHHMAHTVVIGISLCLAADADAAANLAMNGHSSQNTGEMRGSESESETAAAAASQQQQQDGGGGRKGDDDGGKKEGGGRDVVWVADRITDSGKMALIWSSIRSAISIHSSCFHMSHEKESLSQGRICSTAASPTGSPVPLGSLDLPRVSCLLL